jgi:hypothetical protein
MDASKELPRIGRPATSALAEVGIHSLDDLKGRDLDELLELHGVGHKAVSMLREALGDES